jgi:hypothetical protein
MQVRLTRARARILLALIAPILLLIRLSRILRGKPVKRAGKLDPHLLSSISAADPLDYRGERPLLAAFWALGTNWDAGGFDALLNLQRDFAGRCEFLYVEATSESGALRERHRIDIIPTVVLFHRGVELARAVNAFSPELLRAALGEHLSRLNPEPVG